MNIFFNSIVLFIVAAVLALATLAQGTVALIAFLRGGHARWVLILCTVVCLLVAVLAGYGALNTPPQTSSNSSIQTPSPTLGRTYPEQEGSAGATTFASPYSVKDGTEGTKILPGDWVQVSCKVNAPTISSASPDGYWYRIATSPWNNNYYAVANTFLNGDVLGRKPYTHNTDSRVPDC